MRLVPWSACGSRARSRPPGPTPQKPAVVRLAPKPPPRPRPPVLLRSRPRWPRYRSPSVEMAAIVVTDYFVSRARRGRPAGRIVLLNAPQDRCHVRSTLALGRLQALQFMADGFVHHLGKALAPQLGEAANLVDRCGVL